MPRALERIRSALLGPISSESPWFEVARRWQQLSGAVMAKGSEDTATYRWAGLPVQADVGGNPDRVGDAIGGVPPVGCVSDGRSERHVHP